MAIDTHVERRDLARWLSAIWNDPVDEDALTVERPSGGGWSSDTLLVGRNDRAQERVVVRLAPAGPAMFPTYDLQRQWVVMSELTLGGRVPVPSVLDVDPEGVWLGRPAFVMAFVAGRVPTDDRPSFAESGFLHDADPHDQRTFHTGLVHAVAGVHATSISDRLVTGIGGGAGTGLASALDELAEIWDFDRGERWAPIVGASLELLRSTTPADGDAVLLWGDARPANVVVAADGFEPIALLDWELAGIGPPELDITWLAEMNRMRMEGSGVPRLPGFLDDDSTVALYEQRTGRTLRNLKWYRGYSAARVAVLMHRHLRVMVHADRLPADHRLLVDTVATRRLAELLADTR